MDLERKIIIFKIKSIQQFNKFFSWKLMSIFFIFGGWNKDSSINQIWACNMKETWMLCFEIYRFGFWYDLTITSLIFIQNICTHYTIISLFFTKEVFCSSSSQSTETLHCHYKTPLKFIRVWHQDIEFVFLRLLQHFYLRKDITRKLF